MSGVETASLIVAISSVIITGGIVFTKKIKRLNSCCCSCEQDISHQSSDDINNQHNNLIKLFMSKFTPRRKKRNDQNAETENQNED